MTLLNYTLEGKKPRYYLYVGCNGIHHTCDTAKYSCPCIYPHYSTTGYVISINPENGEVRESQSLAGAAYAYVQVVYIYISVLYFLVFLASSLPLSSPFLFPVVILTWFF